MAKNYKSAVISADHHNGIGEAINEYIDKYEKEHNNKSTLEVVNTNYLSGGSVMLASYMVLFQMYRKDTTSMY